MGINTSAQPQKIISYVVLCVKTFSKEFDLSYIESYRYIENFGGLQFIIKHYEIEHTLSIDDTIGDIRAICSKNGGLI
ncbi:MAG: DUF3791 domain-containing protein [Oscillospiraceae bacterium]|nr:DUF3791 domain-containing protein [Oscillospiraceae bacterium]